MTELATIGKNEIVSMDDVRRSLEAITTLEQAKEATDQAFAIDTYANAKKSRELVNQAVELRVWSERRAGQLVIEEKPSYRQMQAKHRVAAQTVNRWIAWALTPEDFLVELISSRRETELSIHALLRDVHESSRKRVAPGIHKLLDGRYVLTWKHKGQTHTRTIGKNHTLEAAKRELDQWKRTTEKPINTDLTVAYSEIRRALNRIDQYRTSANQETQRHINNAIPYLHGAEDEIGKAMRADKIEPGTTEAAA